MRRKKKIIILSLPVLILIAWLFRPLSEKEQQSEAHRQLVSVLFDLNRIDPALFKGDPVIKYEDYEKWYEWTYISGLDTLTIGVPVSRYNFRNIFQDRASISRNSDLWDKLEYTDPIFRKAHPEWPIK